MTLIGTWLALRHLAGPPPHLDAPFGLFPVTILKPLKGAEAGMRENLETFFRLDYPVYEILFSVADRSDPACRIITELMDRNPGVPARLIVGEVNAGPNPKVNNMILAYEQAKFDWLLISDSNVRVHPDYLRRLVAHLEPGVGILTSIVAGCDPDNLGGKLEAAYLNTFYARGMVIAATANQACVIGKSMMLRKSTAARFGGIQVLARYLAEDYVAGEAVRHLGLRIAVARDPIRQHIGEHSLQGFWSRHIRWGRIRKAQSPFVFGLELLLCSWISGLLGALVFHRWLDLPILGFLAAHLGLWCLCDCALMWRISGRLGLDAPLIWVAREFLEIPLWVHAVCGNSVNWRGQRLRLQAGGVLEAK